MTKQEAKDQVAIRNNYSSWAAMWVDLIPYDECNPGDEDLLEQLIDEAMDLYAKDPTS